MSSATLHYGRDSEIALEFAPGALIADCQAPRGDSEHAMQRTREALDEPAGFPPLHRSVVPGDHVVVAIEPGVPESDAIVAAIVECVVRGGVAAADIVVLRTTDDVHAEALDPRRMLTGETRQAVKLETHDPADRGHLGYLANTKSGRPIYLNRALCDADLIVLVGCMRPEHAVTYHGSQGGLYPTFSDTQTQRRFRHPRIIHGDAELIDKAHREVRRVGWLAGTQFTVQVVPGADDTALAIFAGEAEAVERAGRETCRSTWEPVVPQRAALVISALGGGADQQTWDNVGRAIAGALRVVADNGAIALCTELTASPGPALEHLSDVDDRHEALNQVQKLRLADTLPATEIAEALERVRVYLLSNLEESVVEDLGLGAVTDPHDLVRLAKRHSSCIVLADAQYALPTAAEDAVV